MAEHNKRGAINSQKKMREKLGEEAYLKRLSDMAKKGWTDERRKRVSEAMKKQ